MRVPSWGKPYKETTSGIPQDGTIMFLFLIIEGYNFKYYYVVHPRTQYRDNMLQQGF